MNWNPRSTIDLTLAGEQRVALPPCNRLWIPRSVIVNNGGNEAVVANGADFVLGIRLGYGDSRTSEMMPWGIANGLIVSASGKIKEIFVTVLTKGAGNVAYLQSGTDVGLVYASTDGLSPQVFDGIGVGAGSAVSGARLTGPTH